MTSNFSSTKKLRVGIVDDSALIRELLQATINESDDMEVVGVAEDPYVARDMIKDTNPDVITLDVEMPRMNGIEFLEKIMKLRPMPVIMVSSLTQKNAAITVQALEMGAVDYIAKPQNQSDAVAVRHVLQAELIDKLRNVRHINHSNLHVFRETQTKHVAVTEKHSHSNIIGIASSTGGVERLRYMLTNINVNMPPVLIVQHINQQYVENLVERMNTAAAPHLTIKTAQHGEQAMPNHVYFADNKHHMRVYRKNAGFAIRLFDNEPRNGFIASADYLFESLADDFGKNSLGLILSGMGHDGAEGLKKLRDKGAHTIGETEDSCLVYGMPRAAAEAGALSESLSLKAMTKFLNS